jgi:predicted metalloendopeptidase
MGTEMKRIARQEAEEWKKIAAGEDVEIQEVDIIQVQRPMYEVMADLCLEEPWTDWKTWAAFDVRTGAGPKILDQIMQKIAPEEGRIKTFRGKR